MKQSQLDIPGTLSVAEILRTAATGATGRRRRRDRPAHVSRKQFGSGEEMQLIPEYRADTGAVR